ncbi:MAG: SDR family NAD(P)-dependent oxidoreductase [Prevotella sp.]|nr:SDR family NAD(P)-dependent oxidoreductase [Prevotella sp.]
MKRAIVIGASSGIGREVSRQLIERGLLVGVAARREEQLKELVSLAPERVKALRIDVTDSEAPTLLRQLIEQLDGMDLYFHIAGIGNQNPHLEEGIEMRTVETNALGFTRMVGEAFRYFAEKGRGHIAAISSIAGTKGLGPAPSYSATKAMQNTYLQSLEQLAHLRGLDIRFTDIRPGFVNTELLNDGNHYPLMLKAEDVARKAIRAIERRRHVVVIDWRWSVITAVWRRIPKLVWRRLPLQLPR